MRVIRKQILAMSASFLALGAVTSTFLSAGAYESYTANSNYTSTSKYPSGSATHSSNSTSAPRGVNATLTHRSYIPYSAPTKSSPSALSAYDKNGEYSSLYAGTSVDMSGANSSSSAYSENKSEWAGLYR